MQHEALTHGTLLVAVTVGVAALLVAEFFHGVDYLLPVGGALALLAVAGLTFAVSRA